MIVLSVLGLFICLAMSAVFSGSETGFYRLSRVRVDAQARRGGRAARLIRVLLASEGALLVTLLVGNNIALQLLTHLSEVQLDELVGLPAASREVVVTLVLTPVVFLFGELLPKDLFRRRPHGLVGLVAPLVLVAHYVLLPITIPLRILGAALERALGSARHGATLVAGREAVVEMIEQGRRQGALAPHVELLARNALQLRDLPVMRALVPWNQVQTASAALAGSELAKAVLGSRYTRVPVIDEGGPVRRYLHQLDVLAAGEGQSGLDVARPLPSLDPGTTVGQALSTLRTRGQRIALVGTPEAPLGIVTLKDLLEEISGPLAGF